MDPGTPSCTASRLRWLLCKRELPSKKNGVSGLQAKSLVCLTANQGVLNLGGSSGVLFPDPNLAPCTGTAYDPTSHSSSPLDP